MVCHVHRSDWGDFEVVIFIVCLYLLFIWQSCSSQTQFSQRWFSLSVVLPEVFWHFQWQDEVHQNHHQSDLTNKWKTHIRTTHADELFEKNFLHLKKGNIYVGIYFLALLSLIFKMKVNFDFKTILKIHPAVVEFQQF